MEQQHSFLPCDTNQKWIKLQIRSSEQNVETSLTLSWHKKPTKYKETWTSGEPLCYLIVLDETVPSPKFLC